MISRRTLFAGAIPLAALAQAPRSPLPPRDDDNPVRLPNGKLQQDEILKSDYQKTLADCKELIKLAQDLQAELEKNDQHVLSISSLHKSEDLERLAHRIHSRIRH